MRKIFKKKRNLGLQGSRSFHPMLELSRFQAGKLLLRPLGGDSKFQWACRSRKLGPMRGPTADVLDSLSEQRKL